MSTCLRFQRSSVVSQHPNAVTSLAAQGSFPRLFSVGSCPILKPVFRAFSLSNKILAQVHWEALINYSVTRGSSSPPHRSLGINTRPVVKCFRLSQRPYFIRFRHTTGLSFLLYMDGFGLQSGKIAVRNFLLSVVSPHCNLNPV